MTHAYGEQPVPGKADAALALPQPVTVLMEPKTAPEDLLALVHVDTEGNCLTASSSIGTIALEVYWQADTGEGREMYQAGLFPALSPNLDPDAVGNPETTQNRPYALIPPGSAYSVIVRTPLSVAEAEWQEATVPLTQGAKSSVSLGDFMQAYPHVDVRHLSRDTNYDISVTQNTRPALLFAARVEDGEPLMRQQTVGSDGTVTYREQPVAGQFYPSVRKPETAVAIISNRVTVHDSGKDADVQQLTAAGHDGFQRTGPSAAANGGAVEVIVMEGTLVETTGYTFTPFIPIIAELPSVMSDDGPLRMTRDFGDFAPPPPTAPSLQSLETRFAAPETVPVRTLGVRDMRAIAAFRFAIAAETQPAEPAA